MSDRRSKWEDVKAAARRARGRQPAEAAAEVDSRSGGVETLGQVNLSTGCLLVIDFGLLNLWSHDEPPHLDDSVVDPSVAAKANEAQDYEIMRNEFAPCLINRRQARRFSSTAPGR